MPIALLFLMLLLPVADSTVSNPSARSPLGPVLSSTFLGGSGLDGGFCLVPDGKGAVYVAGYTDSADFPTTPGAFDETYNGGGNDYFVAKFDDSFSTLLASTLIGGSNTDGPWGLNLALDADGNVYLAGSTKSTDFPVTAGAYDTTYNGGGTDTFVAKLNGDLTNLLAGTYLGGSLADGGESVAFALHQDGSVLVSGFTKSANFPTTVGAFDRTYNGPSGDLFIARLNGDLSALLASTYLGGNNQDRPGALVVDTAGSVIVAGSTSSVNFPTTPGAYAETMGNLGDGFLCKLDKDLTGLQASTFFGGDGGESINLMALGKDDSLFVSGQIDSQSLPVTPGAYDSTINGSWDNYVARLDNDLANLLGCTYLGGSGLEFGHAICCDDRGYLCLSGGTASADHPVTPGAYQPTYNGGDFDLFLSRLTPDLTTLSASTFLGAGGEEVCYRLVPGAFGTLFLAGPTDSTDFPITPGGYDSTYNGGDRDLYAMRFVLTGMYADAHTLSEQGGVVNFTIIGGTENAGRQYLILGSASGASPGYTLPGGMGVLPINWDALTEVVLRRVNTPLFNGFLGTLDAHGNSTAQIDSGPLGPNYTGKVLHFAGCLDYPFEMVTHPVEIRIVP